jgi:hypothetical protein
MEANFAREKLEGIMKESERKREEMNSVLARNIEFSQLIIDHQRKLRESSESLHAAEEISRKLSMEVSVLKQEKELLSNAEKRASDEVSALSQRVYRLQVGNMRGVQFDLKLCVLFFFFADLLFCRLPWILYKVQRKFVRKQELPREGNKRSILSNFRENGLKPKKNCKKKGAMHGILLRTGIKL